MYLCMISKNSIYDSHLQQINAHPVGTPSSNEMSPDSKTAKSVPYREAVEALMHRCRYTSRHRVQRWRRSSWRRVADGR